jgi:hypothetical protein
VGKFAPQRVSHSSFRVLLFCSGAFTSPLSCPLACAAARAALPHAPAASDRLSPAASPPLRLSNTRQPR